MMLIEMFTLVLYVKITHECSLETLVLVSRHLEDMKDGLGLEIKVLVVILVLVLMKKSRYFRNLDE